MKLNIFRYKFTQEKGSEDVPSIDNLFNNTVQLRAQKFSIKNVLGKILVLLYILASCCHVL